MAWKFSGNDGRVPKNGRPKRFWTLPDSQRLQKMTRVQIHRILGRAWGPFLAGTPTSGGRYGKHRRRGRGRSESSETGERPCTGNAHRSFAGNPEAMSHELPVPNSLAIFLSYSSRNPWTSLRTRGPAPAIRDSGSIPSPTMRRTARINSPRALRWACREITNHQKSLIFIAAFVVGSRQGRKPLHGTSCPRGGPAWPAHWRSRTLLGIRKANIPWPNRECQRFSRGFSRGLMIAACLRLCMRRKQPQAVTKTLPFLNIFNRIPHDPCPNLTKAYTESQLDFNNA